MVLITRSVPHRAERLRSRALPSVTPVTPIVQAVRKASHSPTSTTLGIDLRTGGTNVAATIPVKRAIEN
ncbi:MAG: hypothetical protein E6I96_01305 [Chloroflexi bacterium]|nr:MAG: hypothetical protein E6I96_01305 [Chloroflexota bacterium]